MRKYKSKLNRSIMNLSFHIILIVITLFIAIVSLFVYNNTFKSLKNQTVKEIALEAKSVCKLVDTVIKQTETTVHLLSIDKVVNEYFNIKNIVFLNSELSMRIKSRVQQETFISNYVDSCYFYTADNDFFYDCGSGRANDNFEKQEIKSHIMPYGTESSIEIYPINYSGKYPYFIRFLKQYDYGGRRCAIILNLNIIDMIKFLNLEKVYIADGDNIIYCNDVSDIFTSAKGNDFLKKFYADSKKSGIYKYQNEEFALSSATSGEYGLTYIVFKSLDDYYKEINKQKFLMYIFIFIILIIGLIIAVLHRWGVNNSLQYVSDIIEFPEIIQNSEQAQNNKKIEEISTKILTYITANRQLKDELEERIVENKNLFFKVKQIQISPHFMFNILNSIYISNMEGHTKETSQMILKLAKYMRYVLENENDFITVEKEIENTKIYLDLLQIRYPVLDEIDIFVADNLKKHNIIKFCLQPIVENAVYHGIAKLKNRKGKIKISVFEEKGKLKIVIEDNGVGMDEKKLESVILYMKKTAKKGSDNHIGLSNVYQRIMVMHGEEYGLEIKSKQNVGTAVTLTLQANIITK